MFWTLIIRNSCKNIIIDNIKIIGQWRYNSDGINLCCSENVVVRNCFVRSFDDCIVVRGAYLNEEEDNTKNILVENCVLWCDWGKSLEIWAGDKPCCINNITFTNNYLIHLSMIAIDIRAWFGSNATRIFNILYSNIFIDTDKPYSSLFFLRTGTDRVTQENHCYMPQLLSINYEKLGKSMGNQQHFPATESDNFSLKYFNIVFENIYSNEKQLKGRVLTKPKILDINNLIFKTLPARKLNQIAAIIQNNQSWRCYKILNLAVFWSTLLYNKDKKLVVIQC